MSESPLEEVKGKKPAKKRAKKATPEAKEVAEAVVIPEPEVKEESFLDRMIKERFELDQKIKALFTFTRGEMSGVSKAEQGLLKSQLETMQTYSTILGSRISLHK
jgi:hypothetical protein